MNPTEIKCSGKVYSNGQPSHRGELGSVPEGYTVTVNQVIHGGNRKTFEVMTSTKHIYKIIDKILAHHVLIFTPHLISGGHPNLHELV